MAGTTWPSLIAGQKARASDVESKFDWLEGDLVPMLGGFPTTGVYDLGTSTASWRYIHIAPTGGIMCSGATSMAFVSDGTVKLKNGTNVNEFSTDGTLFDNSDLAVPTEKAVKNYVSLVAGHSPAAAKNSSATTSYFNNTATTDGLAFYYADSIRIDIDSKFTTTTYVGYTGTTAGITTTYSSITSNQIGYKINTGGVYDVEWVGTYDPATKNHMLFISAGDDSHITGTLGSSDQHLSLWDQPTSGSYNFRISGLIYASSATTGYIRFGAIGSGPTNGASWAALTQISIHRVT